MEKKYLKYKTKYLELKNMYGGDIALMKKNDSGRIRVLRNTIDADNIVKLDEYLPAETNRFEIKPATIKFTKNGQCLTSNGNNHENKFSMTPCNENINQEFAVKKIENDYIFSLGSDRTKCIDAPLWMADGKGSPHVWTCADDNMNQRWKVIGTFKNIDSDTGHIIAKLQNLILAYPPYYANEAMDNPLINIDPPIEIATNAIKMDRIAKGMAPPGAADFDSQMTNSEVWCPLIWRALDFMGINVPSQWLVYPHQPSEQLDIYARMLDDTPGWVQYAQYILTDYDINSAEANRLSNDFDMDTLNEAVRIRNLLKSTNSLLKKF